MSEVLAQLEKKSGGSFKRDVLWTNPSPSSSASAFTMSLSASITDYDYIEIEWAESTSALTNVSSILLKSSEFAKYKDPNGNTHQLNPSISARGTGSIYLRCISRQSDTALITTAAGALNTSSVNGSMVIVLHIYGLK